MPTIPGGGGGAPQGFSGEKVQSGPLTALDAEQTDEQQQGLAATDQDPAKKPEPQ